MRAEAIKRIEMAKTNFNITESTNLKGKLEMRIELLNIYTHCHLVPLS